MPSIRATPGVDYPRVRGPGRFLYAACLRRAAVGRSLAGVRRIFALLGGLLGLSGASRPLARAARTLRSQPSIYLVGPRFVKTTWFRTYATLHGRRVCQHK